MGTIRFLGRIILPAMVSVALLAAAHASAEGDNGVAMGLVTLSRGGFLSLDAVSFSDGSAAGAVTHQPTSSAEVSAIIIDCMHFVPGGNFATLGGDLYASGLEQVAGTRHYLRLTDQFGEPGQIGAFVATSTVAGDDASLCGAEDLRGEPIETGDFLFVRPA